MTYVWLLIFAGSMQGYTFDNKKDAIDYLIEHAKRNLCRDHYLNVMKTLCPEDSFVQLITDEDELDPYAYLYRAPFNPIHHYTENEFQQDFT